MPVKPNKPSHPWKKPFNEKQAANNNAVKKELSTVFNKLPKNSGKIK